MFVEKLEEFKQLGMYDVSLMYGEGTGCDDSSVGMMERTVKVLGVPVGCLGEVKLLFVGDVKSFLTFDFKTKPKTISNPPTADEYSIVGYYIWGTERSVESILKNPFFGSWKE